MFGGFLKFMKHRPYGDILGLTTNFKLPINFFLSILTIMMHETLQKEKQDPDIWEFPARME